LEGLGNGFGSPVISGDRFYVTGEIDSMAVLHCFDLDGKLIWQSELGEEWVKSYPGSRSAPTITDDLIYVGTGMGNLYCLATERGKILWSKDFIEDFSGTYPLHGMSEAPVIYKDKVFWMPGGKQHNVVALDRLTGELIWSNPGHGERPGYNTANLIEHNGRPVYVTFSAYHLMGLDARTGELLWSHEQENLAPEERILGMGDTHTNTVQYKDGSLYYVTGDGNGGVRLDLSDDGDEIFEVWRNQGFDNFMGGFIIIGDYIYGNSSLLRSLVSVNISSGLMEDSLKIGNGAVISADSMLYYYNQIGEMKLVSFHGSNLKEVSSFRIKKGTGQHFSHPVINRGILYLRRGKTLMAFDLRNLDS
jgi:outer membrane protein assembly factor BamB